MSILCTLTTVVTLSPPSAWTLEGSSPALPTWDALEVCIL